VFLVPMSPTSAAGPPAGDEHWAYEPKWDGMRAVCRVTRSGCQIWSRRGNDFTLAFPELQALVESLRGHEVVLDGELVCVGSDGRPSFAKIRRRWAPGTERAAAALARTSPATLVAFDLLELDGKPLLDKTYEERRARLGELELKGANWLVTGYQVGGGAAIVEASRQAGLEGVVAKRLRSRYRPGSRSPDWLKLKNYHRERFVVGGWLPSERGSVEALYVGTRTLGRQLTFSGTVEFGLDGQRRRLRELLGVVASDDPTFAGWTTSRRHVRWVKPLLSVEVRFIGYDAGVLREAILEEIGLAELD
jgi:bifunctional non-homologous end joining protein LigD